MNVNTFNTFCFTSNYGCVYPNGVNVIGPLDGNATTYYNVNGLPISGAVIGVRKDAGPWKVQNGQVQTPPTLLFGLGVCTNPRSWAIGIVNTHGDFSRSGNLPDFPPLQCMPQPGIPDGGAGSSNIADPKCLPPSIQFTIGVDGDFWKYMEKVHKCYDKNYDSWWGNPPEEGKEGQGPAQWWTLVNRIIIADLGDGTGGTEPIIINTARFFNSNEGGNSEPDDGTGGDPGDGTTGVSGEWNGSQFTLNPGLYSIGIAFKNGNYVPHVVEVPVAVYNVYEQANFFEAQIFPNPITGDQFQINMQAQVTMKFDYEIWDFYGNQLYSRNFVMHIEQDRTHTINKNNLPSGLLLHRFVFEDGSVKSIQTLKD